MTWGARSRRLSCDGGWVGCRRWKRWCFELDNMQLRSEAREINSIKRELIKHNSQLDSIFKIQENQFQWTKTLEKFSFLVPSEIRIDNISIGPEIGGALPKNKAGNTLAQNNTENFKVVIVGISKTMENLLNFENNLKDSEIFIDFNIDPKNYDGENFRYVLSIQKKNIVSN